MNEDPAQAPAHRAQMGQPAPPPFWQRLAWMGALWAASVVVVGAVAFVIRAWIAP